MAPRKKGLAGQTAKKEKPLKEWAPQTPEAYAQALSSLVHQSFKTINTNTEAGGVRIPSSKGLNLPYVSARTLIGAGIALRMDRYVGAASHVIYSQIDAVCTGRTEGVPESELDLIRGRISEVQEVGAVFGGDHVSPRMKQMLLPKGDSYVAISPVSCAGVAIVLQEARSRHNERVFANREHKDVDVGKPIAAASFPVGGDKSLNAGGLVYRMQQTLYAAPPGTQQEVKYALALHHRGFTTPPIPPRLMKEYLAWRAEVHEKTDNNMDARSRHREIIQSIARAMLSAGANARRVLLDHTSFLPDEANQNNRLVSDQAGLWSQGLIDPEARSKEWPTLMARVASRAISAWEVHKGKPLALSQHELNQITGYFEEALR